MHGPLFKEQFLLAADPPLLTITNARPSVRPNDRSGNGVARLVKRAGGVALTTAGVVALAKRRLRLMKPGRFRSE